MILDLTTKISSEQMESWLEKDEQRHITSGHIGTHLDTYRKTPISLEYFKSPGVLIDVTDFCEHREIMAEDIAGLQIPPASFVIFRTARIEHVSYGSTEYFKDHPQLSKELIDVLLSLNIRFIGIDCSGIRRGDEHRNADILCEENGVYVIENLCNLNQLNSAEFTVYTMWLDDPAMTGLKCRVLAEFR